MTRAVLIAALAMLSLLSCSQEGEDLARYVDPLIGTGGHGHTFPAATVPFGMIQLGPDTRLTGWDGCSAYHFSDDVVYGFSHTHLSGTGCSDYGDILVTATTGEPLLVQGEGDDTATGYVIPSDTIVHRTPAMLDGPPLSESTSMPASVRKSP